MYDKNDKIKCIIERMSNYRRCGKSQLYLKNLCRAEMLKPLVLNVGHLSIEGVNLKQR